jgi:membrane-associated phospholipid phosphatase
MHTAVAGGAAVVLALTYSPAFWALTIAVAAIAWSRVELGDHTRHQVIGGAIVGALVGGGLFAALILG